MNYSGQDWEPVIFNTSKKSNSTSNSNKDTNIKAVIEEDVPEKKTVISLSNSKLIQQARQLKKMTQQQLAQKINKDQKTIQLYESGKIIPEYNIMCKIEKTLGIKLNKKKSQ